MTRIADKPRVGKRFEGEEPTFQDILAAFQKLGLTDLLGTPGPATAFASQLPLADHVEFGVVPGSFSAKEIAELRAWAA